MNLTDYLPHIASVIASGSIIGAIDHQIAKAQSLIPQSLWQLAKRYFLNQPIRAQQAVQPQEKGNNTMAFIDEIKKVVEEMEELGKRGMAALDMLTLFAEKAAPVAAAIAPMTGSAAPAVAAGAAAAETLAPLAHEVIQAAEAQPPTP